MIKHKNSLLAQGNSVLMFVNAHPAQAIFRIDNNDKLPSEHLADMPAFLLATCLRTSNVIGLERRQVDLARQMAWVHPDQTKARRAIAVPLNE